MKMKFECVLYFLWCSIVLKKMMKEFIPLRGTKPVGNFIARSVCILLP
jgi:hypothetical protein